MLILPPGHARDAAARRHRRLTGRERWLLGGGGLLTVALILVAVFAIAGGSTPEARPGCIDVSFASSVGNAEVTGCGASAKAICAQVGQPGGYSGAPGRLIAARCRELGLTVG